MVTPNRSVKKLTPGPKIVRAGSGPKRTSLTRKSGGQPIGMGRESLALADAIVGVQPNPWLKVGWAVWRALNK